MLPVLTLIPRSQLAQMTRITERHVKRLRNGHQQPLPKTRARLTRAAADYARVHLGPDAPADDIAACAALLDRQMKQTRTQRETEHAPNLDRRREQPPGPEAGGDLPPPLIS